MGTFKNPRDGATRVVAATDYLSRCLVFEHAHPPNIVPDQKRGLTRSMNQSHVVIGKERSHQILKPKYGRPTAFMVCETRDFCCNYISLSTSPILRSDWIGGRIVLRMPRGRARGSLGVRIGHRGMCGPETSLSRVVSSPQRGATRKQNHR
jgi:hypothetical protein